MPNADISCRRPTVGTSSTTRSIQCITDGQGSRMPRPRRSRSPDYVLAGKGHRHLERKQRHLEAVTGKKVAWILERGSIHQAWRIIKVVTITQCAWWVSDADKTRDLRREVDSCRSVGAACHRRSRWSLRVTLYLRIPVGTLTAFGLPASEPTGGSILP